MSQNQQRLTRRKYPEKQEGEEEEDEEQEEEEEEASESANSAYSHSAGSSYSPTTNSTPSPPGSPSSSHPPQLIIVNGKLIDTRSKSNENLKELSKPRKYLCHWEGCHKSYTKPVRLEEHLRSHTNEVLHSYYYSP
ncbi:hypothetical protein VP01_1932g1 [Puccinia sorghi]|uniref:C2H2-type domain-containing protein n=1 Tax=Puccinia sorghi TaxID=27349 RepID=A0A0L6VCI8_9BASI|nr:hypothetical protein VP01_1932g1 [Puccinia sorghi]